MRRVIHVLLFLLVFLSVGIARAPLSFVMDRIESGQPALKHLVASGSIWNGDVAGLRFGPQSFGNLSLRTQLTALLRGRWKTRFELTGGAIAGRGQLSVGLDNSLLMQDVRVSGATGELIGLRPEIRSLDGRFTFDIAQLSLKGQKCVSASGTVWTDILSKLESRWRWKGPELIGPLTCRNGRLFVEMIGEGEQSELVSVTLDLGLNNTADFEAKITNPPDDVAQAASLLGFVYNGTSAITYRFRLDAAGTRSVN